ncbi:unnamed protein product [Phyllotreta striolata]|uniref:Organic cation transporter protein n=1 Tax=Phyllotreta striolata TaxID=444603 RepID=A0A9N9TJ28_PHYSR|nr:unnamed protein product [Phyllotreta striolata]
MSKRNYSYYIKWRRHEIDEGVKERMTRHNQVDFDDVLEEIGELGRYQIVIYILVCLPVLFGAANSLSYVFTAGVPQYRCLIPECETPDSAKFDAPFIKFAIPHETEGKRVLALNTEACSRYKTKPNDDSCTPEAFTKTIEQCSEFVFEGTERTIVNEWLLTCLENQWKLALVGSTHFAGIIVGSFLFGVLADRYGRKLLFIIAIFIMTVAGILQVVSPNYWVFIFFLFLNAVGTSGIFPLAFIIGIEMVGKRKREFAGFVLNYFYAIGEALVAPIAYLEPRWKNIQLVVSAPAAVFLVYYWFIPESVRWLLARGKLTRAKKIILTAADYNNVTVTDNLLDSLKETTNLQSFNDEQKSEKIFPVVKYICLSRKLVIRFLIVYVIWIVNSFVFYGLSINATALSGSKYINFALVTLVEIPGYTLAWVCIQKMGRRYSLIGFLLLSGVTCTLTIFVQNTNLNWLVIMLFLIGKLGVTAAFSTTYVYTAEMLPTIVRSGGVGSMSTIGRFGALVAPFVPLLGLYWAPLPMLIFGFLAIGAGLLAFKLPETYGSKLPETAEEAELL